MRTRKRKKEKKKRENRSEQHTFVLHPPFQFHNDGFARQVVQKGLRVHRHSLKNTQPSTPHLFQCRHQKCSSKQRPSGSVKSSKKTTDNTKMSRRERVKFTKLTAMIHTTIQNMRNTYRHDGCSGGEEKSTPRARRESELGRRSSTREREGGRGAPRAWRQAGMEAGI